MQASIAGRRIGLLTANASRLGGGVFEAVVGQAAIIRANGAVPVVIALRDRHSDEDRVRLGDAECVYAERLGPRQIGYAPDLLGSLTGLELDCLHLHGIWMYPSAAAPLWAARTARPYIVSPHGMLDPWITSRGRWKKAAARVAYERRNWRNAAFLHALTEAEARDIARESARSDAVVIPNPAAPVARANADRAPGPTVLYIGRIHEKKNLASLIGAWKQAALPARARLCIAGWGSDADVAGLRSELADAPASIEFVGPVFGDAKERLLRAARFVILPSFSEGLPMAMIEAWARGIPTIMTAACNLPVGLACGAALETGYRAHAIADSLALALALDDEAWLARSAAASALVEQTFSPSAVGERWVASYAAAMATAGLPR